MPSTQPLPRVVLPPAPGSPPSSTSAGRRGLEQTGKMPRLELESLLREASDEPPPSSIAFPLVTRRQLELSRRI